MAAGTHYVGAKNVTSYVEVSVSLSLSCTFSYDGNRTCWFLSLWS